MAEKFLKAAQARQEKAAGQIAASDSQLTIGYGSEGEKPIDLPHPSTGQIGGEFNRLPQEKDL